MKNNKEMCASGSAGVATGVGVGVGTGFAVKSALAGVAAGASCALFTTTALVVACNAGCDCNRCKNSGQGETASLNKNETEGCCGLFSFFKDSSQGEDNEKTQARKGPTLYTMN